MKMQRQGSYCSVARTIEIVGERWSLLVVRDLLPGPRRFSDLIGSIGGITPKLLTLRLRELESSGIVHRDEESGRRDVWYSLTAAGQALRPVVREMIIWGIYHGAPPEPDETVISRRAATSATAIFNREGFAPPRPVTWSINLGAGEPGAIRFDGSNWETVPDASPADVGLVITSTPRAWVDLVRTPPGERAERAKSIHLEGSVEQIAMFRGLFAG